MAEPILWANKAEGMRRQLARTFNPSSGQMEQVIDQETGQPLFEKIPQRGHAGDSGYDNPRQMRSQRWMHVLRHDGHVVRVPITNAAADQDSNSEYSRYQMAKARHFGWIEVGHCPGALVLSGRIEKHHLASDSAKASVTSPCAHGTYGASKWCPHYMAEEQARKARQAKFQGKRDRDFMPEAEKLMRSQEAQTEKMVSGVAEGVAEAVAKALSAKGSGKRDG